MQWQPRARYVWDKTDGQQPLLTSSGVSAGTDAALGLIADVWGEPQADKVARMAEYEGKWRDKDTDPFAVGFHMGVLVFAGMGAAGGATGAGAGAGGGTTPMESRMNCIRWSSRSCSAPDTPSASSRS